MSKEEKHIPEPNLKGCIRRRVFLQGPKKHGREVCEELVFKVDGNFESMYAAERWLTENGYSRGSSCASSPTGLLKGDYHIAKWKNLTKKEKYHLDGVMEGDLRNGPLTISIYYTSR